jgi:TIR domain-containing protein
MPRIAISYRRADTSAIAGRIFDRLVAHFGKDALFMDIDSIPVGVDFRSHIEKTLQHVDVLIAIVGVNWLAIGADGKARINEENDPVRLEIKTAVERKTPIIPVLVEGAKMPSSLHLPAEFGNFAFLNAAEVSSGRDFRTHTDRLIGAINQILGIDGSVDNYQATITAISQPVPEGKSPVAGSHHMGIVQYVGASLILLLVAHYVMLINDLNNMYLWLTAMAVPCGFGFWQFWMSGRGGWPVAFCAIALGLFGVAGMTLSESLISGDPILPRNRFEWRDDLQFAFAITLSFLAGRMLARGLRAALNWKFVRL